MAVAERVLDVDQRAVVDQLRAVVDASGLTQRDFAHALGTSPSRLSAYLHGDTAPSAPLLNRFLRIGGALAVAREQRVPVSLDAAAAVRLALCRAARPSGGLRYVLEARDRLRDTMRHRPELVDAWEAKASIGDERWDTLFRAVVEHEFVRAGRSGPDWTHTDGLARPWVWASLRLNPTQVQQQTPEWLADKGILIAESDLVTT